LLPVCGLDWQVLLSECGVPLSKRFAFYDQIHTVGMDIKQTLDAIAAVTLGKDMTLRDYTQACWRMRGLGKGQTVHLYIVGELPPLPPPPPLPLHILTQLPRDGSRCLHK
jgi:hypothetical protein